MLQATCQPLVPILHECNMTALWEEHHLHIVSTLAAAKQKRWVETNDYFSSDKFIFLSTYNLCCMRDVCRCRYLTAV